MKGALLLLLTAGLFLAARAQYFPPYCQGLTGITSCIECLAKSPPGSPSHACYYCGWRSGGAAGRAAGPASDHGPTRRRWGGLQGRRRA